jgi:hypothetical protein
MMFDSLKELEEALRHFKSEANEYVKHFPKE